MIDDVDRPSANAIFAKFVLLGQCQSHLSALRVQSPSAADTFISLISRVTLNAPDDTQRLTFLEKVVEEICTDLESFGADVKQFCKWCRSVPSTIANPPPDPFEAIRRSVVALTIDFYSNLGLTEFQLETAVPASLEVTTNPPGKFKSASGIIAFVSSRSPPGVIVKVCPEAFDRPSIFAVPYVFLHEYICHGARAALGGPPAAETTSIFSEGWMDFVALTLHNRVLDGGGHFGAPCIPADDCKSAANQLHLDRCHEDRFDNETNKRSFGRNVAANFLEVYPGTKFDNSPLFRISAELAGSAIGYETLDLMIWSISSIFRESSLVGDPAGLEKLLVLNGLVHDQSMEAATFVEGVMRLA